MASYDPSEAMPTTAPEINVVGFWAGKMRYVILDMDTKQEYPVWIPGMEQNPPLYDRSELAELLHWQMERTIQQIKQERAHPKPELTEIQQHDLGKTLMQVRASKKLRNQTGHGRYWEN